MFGRSEVRMDGAGRVAIELLIREANDLRKAGRYRESQRVAEHARDAARGIGSVDLEVRATERLADALRMQGDFEGALAQYTRIFGVAQDPVHARAMDQESVRWSVALAWMHWVGCAEFLSQIEVAKLHRVLDEGEAWLRGVGKAHWRAGLLQQRARVLETQGQGEKAVGYAEEAVALARRHPEAPGGTLASYRWVLGNLLRDLGRPSDAIRHYQDVLDDPRSILHDRFAAHVGLGHCALAEQDASGAMRHARNAVEIAEGLGDDALCPALELRVAACRQGGDRDGARQAVEQYLRNARRLGSEYRLYYALRDGADVALDDGDRVQATVLLAELGPLAQAMDRRTGTSSYTQEFARRRTRFDALPP